MAQLYDGLMGQDQEIDHQRTSVVDEDLARYRPVSRLAVAGLGLGLASALAITVPLLWFLAFLGAWASLVALRKIRQGQPELSGVAAARAGLFLSLVFGSAVPAQMVATRWWIDQQAQQFADQWFEYLTAGKPQKALQLSEDPSSRRNVNNDFAVWRYYRSDATARSELEFFARQPVVRALLELGSQAQVRYFATKSIEQQANRDLLTLVYAVTYRRASTETFFVEIELEHLPHPITNSSEWKIAGYLGPVAPEPATN